MSGIGFFELVIIFMIGLVVLGPKRLPKVANQLGTWVGQARRMARVMKRQLEEELDMKEDLDDLRSLRDDFRKDLSIDPGKPYIPRDDDSYSAAHGKPEKPASAPADKAGAGAGRPSDPAGQSDKTPTEESKA